MFHDQSRLRLSRVVPGTALGRGRRPAYLDLRMRAGGYGEDDRMAVVSATYQWSHIGVERLGDARNWWAVADLSDVVDPFEELTMGRVLRVPSVERFLFRILAPEET